MAWGKQRHATCKTSSFKYPHGSQSSSAPQQGRSKEGATLHPGARKHTLQYDRRPDGRFGEQLWTWILGILSGNGDGCEEQREDD